MKKFAFFPGCVLEGAAKEAYDSTEKVTKALGIELVEIPGWTCCGASHVQDINEIVALSINARNIALAEQMNLPILTVCNTCTLMLRKAKAKLDSDPKVKAQVNAILAQAGLEYKGTSEITHLLWVLAKEPELVKSKVKKPLTGIKIGGYYGCHILRPQKIMDFEDYGNPESLENLIRDLGAEPINFSAKHDCCGFHAVWTAEQDVIKATGKSVKSAFDAGADLMVTPCPLCQMQLDMYQPEGREAVGNHPAIPILHLAQIIGLSIGFNPDEMGIKRHVSAADKIIKILA